jgi:protein CpxP
MHGHVLGFGPLLHALSLTDAQKAQVQDAFTTYRATMKSLREQIRTARQQLEDILVSPTAPDPSILQSAEQNLANLQGQSLQARLTLAQAIHDILSHDQLVQATQLKDQLRTLQTTRRELLSPPPQSGQ